MTINRSIPIEHALWLNPFDGEEADITLLSDKIVTAAKDHPRCQICEAPILKGEVHRVLTERLNEGLGQVMSFRFCNKCTRAMASYFAAELDDSYRLLDSRYRIGYERRRAKDE